MDARRGLLTGDPLGGPARLRAAVVASALVTRAPAAVDDRSYRALLAVPSIGRVLLGMQISRIAQTMVGVAMVLFALATYHSPALAGLVTFASIAPGLLVSPIAGALLDRHGRVRLVILDYLIAGGSLALIASLALLGLLPAWLLLLIAAVSSLTGPLSATGLRSLFPLLVPRHLWERVNAVDSNGYVLASVVGPPIAGVLVQTWGGPPALLCMAGLHWLAALVLVGSPDPRTETDSSGRLLLDAWRGLVYTWRNPTLRALGFSISVLNLSAGMVTIVVPLLILERLHEGAAAVGAVFAVQGLFGVAAAFVSGRLDSEGRERAMLVLPMLGCAAATALLLLGTGSLPAVGLLAILAAMALNGLLNGPMDIALFTLRQRRTDQAWMGRAFAVSMSFNFMGFPLGSALAGQVAGASLEVAIVLGTLACLGAALIARFAIPVEGA